MELLIYYIILAASFSLSTFLTVFKTIKLYYKYKTNEILGIEHSIAFILLCIILFPVVAFLVLYNYKGFIVGYTDGLISGQEG